MEQRVRRRPAAAPVSRLVACLITVLACLAVVAGLGGCSAGSAQHDAGARAEPPPASSSVTGSDPSGRPEGTDPRFATYVALGDSYTAAPLVPRTDISSGCLRSSGNYPSRVAAALPGTRLVDVSCSGATTADLTRVQRIGGERVPPQLDAVSRGTDLVTIGIGGNDFHLFATLIGTCTRLRAADPEGSPCHDQLTGGGSDQLARELAGIRRHVAGAVARVRERAPDATLVVVGYPQIIPARGTCPGRLPLATGDYPYAREINEGLARAVEAGAAGADAYVDVFRRTRGHDVCADDPWINGQTTDMNRALAYHPFAAEQAAVARLVLAALR